ncbi:MAG: 2-deoxy-D-gluconate 3-dehydrogenase [Alphaproteobacteria bacterium HGW-Alphaproteobacteria-16]|nr:MAG: 2-deoxy-D-gluconate 3-dehydrogenase [Alphaproteobacteria bacterium HGW-Alphaproteobacteria-16]
MNFTGKRAVVTGGVGGIGGAISQALRAAGAEVIATGYNQAEVDARATHPDLAGVSLAALDVGDDTAVRAFAATTGVIDFLVNCAGTTARGPEAFEEAAFEHVIDVNLTGTMRCCRAFREALAARGGTIVNIASVMSYTGSGTAPGYAASKGGVALLTKSLAIAWAEQGIRVNAVAPGWIVTPLTDAQIDPSLRERVIARTPMRRWGEPRFIADAVEFLCSDKASFITGVILPVDGGYLAV